MKRGIEETLLLAGILLLVIASLLMIGNSHAADVVPPEIQLPGTQPNEVSNFESPDKCDNCHAVY
ncbi:MAG: hypothetical protein KAJ65_00710 [Gammaproteobacteria bacterium]|nr:hypothetical protein [Gammaproteobacteria bacterium]